MPRHLVVSDNKDQRGWRKRYMIKQERKMGLHLGGLRGL